MYDIIPPSEELLRIIANNARISIIELAQKIKTTPRICQYRIRNLEKKNIIIAYKSNLNEQKINKIFCKIIIYLSNTTKDRLNKFISYASLIKGALWPQRMLGNWDFEIDLESENYEKFQEIDRLEMERWLFFLKKEMNWFKNYYDSR